MRRFLLFVLGNPLSVGRIGADGGRQLGFPLVSVGQKLLCKIVSMHATQITGEGGISGVVVRYAPLLYSSSSRVSVAYSALGLSTMASTGHDSWQKPQ